MNSFSSSLLFLLAFSSRLLMKTSLLHFFSLQSKPPMKTCRSALSPFTSTEIHKNVISSLEGDAKEHVLQQKHTDLKQKMRDLNQGFERLRKISHEGFTEDSGERQKAPTCALSLSLSSPHFAPLTTSA